MVHKIMEKIKKRIKEDKKWLDKCPSKKEKSLIRHEIEVLNSLIGD